MSIIIEPLHIFASLVGHPNVIASVMDFFVAVFCYVLLTLFVLAAITVILQAFLFIHTVVFTASMLAALVVVPAAIFYFYMRAIPGCITSLCVSWQPLFTMLFIHSRFLSDLISTLQYKTIHRSSLHTVLDFKYQTSNSIDVFLYLTGSDLKIYNEFSNNAFTTRSCNSPMHSLQIFHI